MDESLIKNVMNDRFAKLIGIELVEVHEGYALTRLKLREDHLNGVDMVQGGVIFTLADYAFAAASNSGSCTTVGLNVNITYFKSPSGKTIQAEAREISVQNRVSGYHVDILDEDGTLIACFSGLGYRKKEKIT